MTPGLGNCGNLVSGILQRPVGCNGREAEKLDYEIVKRHREKNYAEITMSREMIRMQGHLMHLHHELMISRFRFLLERRVAN